MFTCKSNKNGEIKTKYISFHAKKEDILACDFISGPKRSQLLNEFELNEKNLNEVTFQYITLKSNHRIILFAAYQITTLTYKNLKITEKKGLLKKLLSLLLSLKFIRILILGNIIRNNKPYLFYDEDALDKSEALKHIAEISEELAKKTCSSVVIIKDVEITDDKFKTLTSNGYIHPLPDMGMVMTIKDYWKNLDDYITELRRKYAARARKIRNNFTGFDIKNLELKDIEIAQPRLYQLFLEVVNKQGFYLTLPSPTLFAAFKKNSDESFQVEGIFYEDELVGFYSYFITEKELEVFYIGFDPLLNLETSLYFNILFLVLEKAIKLKKEKLILGRTSLDAKASMGAEIIHYPYLIKIKNLPSFAIQWFIEYFTSLENNHWKERNPFIENSDKIELDITRRY